MSEKKRGGGEKFENAYVINREGVLKCLRLLTWGEGGVKNGLNCAYVICGRPLGEMKTVKCLSLYLIY